MSGDFIFGFTTIIGVFGCAALIWLGMKGVRSFGENYFLGENTIIVALAGFAVFPIINFLLFVGTLIYLMFFSEWARAGRP